MNDEKSIAVPVAGETSTDGSDIRYVGFCDILGFSSRILTDFDKTLEVVPCTTNAAVPQLWCNHHTHLRIITNKTGPRATLLDDCFN